jgi:hypothetical protein
MEQKQLKRLYKDDQDPEKKTHTWGNAVRSEMRAAGARKEMEKAIQTHVL